MSQKRDTDYLAVSTRIHAMENRMLTRERMERMIDAKDSGEAAKVLSECGYGELTQLTSAALEELLADARRNTFRDMTDSVPDRRLVEVFQLKYDYHNAKVLIKAQAMGLDEARLLSQGGRYDPQRLREDFLRDDLRDWGEVFRQAVLRAREVLAATGDPQQADLVLVCRKSFVQAMDPANMPEDAKEKWYPNKDYHVMYMAEIVRVLTK